MYLKQEDYWTWMVLLTAATLAIAVIGLWLADRLKKSGPAEKHLCRSFLVMNLKRNILEDPEYSLS